MKQKWVTFVVLAVVVLSPVIILAQDELPDFVTLITADDVMAHVSALSVDIGARVTGTEAEEQAADYIADELESWGYAVEIQEFEVDLSEYADDDAEQEPFTSRNVIATREGDDQVIVIGAHMDSVDAATGAGDNASGVAAIDGVASCAAAGTALSGLTVGSGGGNKTNHTRITAKLSAVAIRRFLF